MKISDQGFTERISSQPNRTEANSSYGHGSSSGLGRQSSSDNLQLSNLASLLQNGYSDGTNRSARISQISQALQSGTFQSNSSQISSAIVSEAVQGALY